MNKISFELGSTTPEVVRRRHPQELQKRVQKPSKKIRHYLMVKAELADWD